MSNVAITATAIACVTAMTISVYPGVLNDLFLITILLSFLVVPTVGAILLAVVTYLAVEGKLRRPKIPWKGIAAVFTILLATYVLLKFYVPRRIAFALSQSTFEAQLAKASPSARGGAPMNSMIGVYRVDKFAADPRGGVFFRVHSGKDGIGPDAMTYGFAHKPNAEGTPFGAAHYRTYRLGGDWFWFHASDDWD